MYIKNFKYVIEVEMAVYKYLISDLLIKINAEEENLLKHFIDFFICEQGENLKYNLETDVFANEIINIPPGDIIINDSIRWINLKDGSDRKCVCAVRQDNTVLSSLIVDKNWSKAEIVYLLNDNIWQWKSSLSLFEILFRNCLINYNGIVIHGSAIEWQNQAIIFTAPSGTGKTTQSDLWKKYLGAKVLNGDRPAIRIINNQAVVYGTPWSGSSKEYINKKVPLTALVLLEQASTNSIKRLNIFEALNRIMPRFFLPYNDKHLMELAAKTIGTIIETIPVYLLKCTPEKEAMDVAYKCIIKD